MKKRIIIKPGDLELLYGELEKRNCVLKQDGGPFAAYHNFEEKIEEIKNKAGIYVLGESKRIQKTNIVTIQRYIIKNKKKGHIRFVIDCKKKIEIDSSNKAISEFCRYHKLFFTFVYGQRVKQSFKFWHMYGRVVGIGRRNHEWLGESGQVLFVIPESRFAERYDGGWSQHLDPLYCYGGSCDRYYGRCHHPECLEPAPKKEK